MLVAVAGAHGKVAMELHPLLTGRGDRVRGLIRNPAHADEVAERGAEPVVCDLEETDDVSPFLDGVEGVIFAAGAGEGSGTERKRTMDLGGAVKLIEAAKRTGIRRFVIVSAMGVASPPPSGGDVFGEYLRAKAAADDALRASGLDYTIVRPGRLTDEPGTGKVTAGQSLEGGEIPRADVAAVLAEVLGRPVTISKTFDVVSGETPIPEALESLGEAEVRPTTRP